ncbi:hypothetical protein GYA93_14605 [Gordonia desulfuricans]|uniref:Uncharacterized protein n=1 Tax=Gordonia desulfuricans TaxID=89051 RepID=A0A7K3LRD3_9ACTN|nr:hypothetical protein [Gordonia desulfuricans]NDK90803.1 hypothetical protein [Gordonia desulfuricans]
MADDVASMVADDAASTVTESSEGAPIGVCRREPGFAMPGVARSEILTPPTPSLPGMVRGRRWRITLDVIQIRAGEQLSTVDDRTMVRRVVGAEPDEMQQRPASAQWVQGWTAMVEAARGRSVPHLGDGTSGGLSPPGTSRLVAERTVHSRSRRKAKAAVRESL